MTTGIEDKWKAMSLTEAEEEALIVEDEADELGHKPTVMAIANKKGSFVEFDGTDLFGYRKYLTFRVDLDITRPLIRGMKIRVGAKDCAYYDEEIPESMYPHGAWMSASPTRNSGGGTLMDEENDGRANKTGRNEKMGSMMVTSVVPYNKEVKGDVSMEEGEGDFNKFMNSEEKMGGPLRDHKLLDDFKQVIEDYGFLDLGYFGFPYTWWNGRDGDQSVHERSDQACGAVVEKAWGEGIGDGATMVPCRLGMVNYALRKWSKEEFGSIQEQLKNKKDMLTFLANIRPTKEVCDEYCKILKEFNDRMVKEEIY
ncbi:MTSS1-like protein [Bienertia sinuspersici]